MMDRRLRDWRKGKLDGCGKPDLKMPSSTMEKLVGGSKTSSWSLFMLRFFCSSIPLFVPLSFGSGGCIYADIEAEAENRECSLKRFANSNTNKRRGGVDGLVFGLWFRWGRRKEQRYDAVGGGGGGFSGFVYLFFCFLFSGVKKSEWVLVCCEKGGEGKRETRK